MDVTDYEKSINETNKSMIKSKDIIKMNDNEDLEI